MKQFTRSLSHIQHLTSRHGVLAIAFALLSTTCTMAAPALASGTGPGDDNPVAAWDWCMQEAVKSAVWNAHLEPEAAVQDAYKVCRHDFKGALMSLADDTQRNALRAQSASDHSMRVAFAKEMKEKGDPMLGDYDPDPSASEPPQQGNKGGESAEIVKVATPAASPDLPKIYYDRGVVKARRHTVACVWSSDIPKWISLVNAGRDDLTTQLNCLPVRKGTALIQVDVLGNMQKVVVKDGSTAEEYWVNASDVANDLDQAISDKCLGLLDPAYDVCAKVLMDQYVPK
ncbi:MAG: hypothetical protein LCH46_00025 [Proteobacteria bacterium]|nr:hypothetical protein [Pseudomonadota bacterium]